MKSSSTDSSSFRRYRHYLALILIGVVIALTVTEVLLRLYVVPIENTRPNRVHMVYTGKQPDVILGDSHFYRGFITTSGYANLARGGSSPAALEIIAREYFRFREPGRVIVEASPQLFNRLMQNRGPQQHDEYFGQNVGLPFALYVFEPGIARYAGSLVDISELKRRAAVALNQRVGVSRFERRIQHERPRRPPERLRKRAAGRVRHDRPVDGIRESEGFAVYRRLLDFLKQRGAQVCMVRTPVDELFLELIADDESYREAQRALEETAREFGFRYVDFRDLPVKLVDRHFMNADHLGTEGAALFGPAVLRACYR